MQKIITKLTRNNPFRHLFPYLKKHKTAIALGAACLICTNAFGLLVPWLIKEAIDSLAHPYSQPPLSYSFYIVTAVACQAVFRYFWRRYLFGAAHTLEYDLRNDFFKRLLSLPQNFFHKIRSGDIISRAISDLSAVRQFIVMGSLGIIDGIFLALTTISLMFVISPKLTSLIFLPMAMVTYFVIKLGPQIREGFLKVQESLGKLSAHTQENVTGNKVVQAYVQEEQQVERFDILAKDYLEKNISLVKIHAKFEPLLSFVAGICAILVLILGGREIMLGKLTVGGLAAFMAYLAMLAWPMTALGILVNQYQRGRAAMLRIQEILDAIPESSYSTQVLFPNSNDHSLEFIHLTFSYNGKNILNGLSGKIPEGKWIAIMGKTGCGKSTLVNLIARIFNPPAGTIKMGGIDIRDIELKNLRERIGFVGQDIFLFSESIAENVRFAQPSSAKETIEKALQNSGLADDLAKFPNGMETVIGERGVTLSGGQKQRTAIARAIVRNPDILILDDAFSNIDFDIEKQIVACLREIRKNKTTILISHRVSTASLADEVWLVENGRVANCLSPTELAQQKGFYTEFNKNQDFF